MAKHAYYFTHDFNAHNDERILDLRMDLGLEGYGAYWFLLELLANSKDYTLEANFLRLAFTMGCKTEVVQKIIENSSLFTLEDGYFWSESLKDRLSRLDEIKQKRAEAGRKGGKSKAIAKQMSSKKKPIAKQNQAEERKEKDRKEKNFTEFWNLYEKKNDRAKSEAKFLSLSLEETELILKVLPQYLADAPDVKYRKNPLTWLNGKCWLDYEDLKPVNSKAQRIKEMM